MSSSDGVEAEIIYDVPQARAPQRDWLEEARFASFRGDHSRAIAAAREALAVDGRSGEAWHIRAQSSFALDRYEDAEFAAREAAALAPGVGDVHDMLANIYEAQQRYQEAQREAEEAIRLAPSQHRYRGTLASIHTSRGAPGEAIPILHQLVREVPGEWLYRRELADALDRDATKRWTLLPDGNRIITSAEQARVSRANAERGLALEFDDNELRQRLRESIQAADVAERKRWRLPTNRVTAFLYGAVLAILIVGGLGGLAGLASGHVDSAAFGFLLLLVAGAIVWVYVRRHHVPVWQLDAKTAARWGRGR